MIYPLYTMNLFAYSLSLPASAARPARLSVLFLLGLYWLVLMHIPWPNSGDYGMNLPSNLLSWAVISLMMLIVWLSLRTGTLRLTRTALLMLVSAVLFTLPLLWSPREGLPGALPRLVGIWGGVLCYFTLLQCRIQERETVGLFNLLAVATVVECGMSLVGIFCPDYLPFPLDILSERYSGRAPGNFQQVNVAASFLATGLTALLFLMADVRCASRRARAETWRRVFIGLSIMMVSATLVLFQSRTGWLGAIIGMLCVSLLFSQPRFRLRTTRLRRMMIVVLPVLGGTIGALLLDRSVAASLAHESSSHQRWLTLYYTFRMILAHPWQGWGLGMFEPAFQNFMAALPYDNPSREMMQHPHNETLFIWAEGGALALAGGLCLLSGWVVLVLRRKSLWQWAALLTTLPILLHTQLEFPLYYSVAHFFALLLLMAASEGERRVLTLSSKKLGFALAAVALYGVILSAQLFYASLTLGRFETGSLVRLESIRQLSVPWLMQMRYQRDISLLHLNAFNQQGDIAALAIYAQENRQWIALHMEENAYFDQINILTFLHRAEEAAALQARAHRLMPWDERFNP